jgi:hypothetical protein
MAGSHEGLGQVLGQPIKHPSAWYAEDMRSRQQEWVYTLSEQDVAELEAATAAAAATGKPVEDVTLADFPLPTLGPKLRALLREVTHGRGFQLLSGVPVERWTHEQSILAYWGMGLYWGEVRPINKQGHLLGHIKDIGLDPNAPTTRLYATSAPQPIHNDGERGWGGDGHFWLHGACGCATAYAKPSNAASLYASELTLHPALLTPPAGPADVVTLLCLNPAKEGGGESSARAGWGGGTSVRNQSGTSALQGPTAWPHQLAHRCTCLSPTLPNPTQFTLYPPHSHSLYLVLIHHCVQRDPQAPPRPAGGAGGPLVL